MSRTTTERYLRELDEELRDLPPGRRRELLDEIREHIDSALGDEASADEAEVRNVLERLGDPSEIAGEARDRFGIARAKPGPREILTLILLPLGGFIWVIGWVVGAILLVTSRVWTIREKLVGLLVVPFGLLPASLLGVMPGRTCSEVIDSSGVVSGSCSGGLPAWLGYPVFAVLVIGPIWTVLFLATRMNRRSGT